jgi:hypothetical protein
VQRAEQQVVDHVACHTRERMGLFGRKKQGLTLDGIQGVALVLELEDFSNDTSEDTSLADYGIGNVKRWMRLEVTLDDGRPAYHVEGKQKFPAKRSGDLADGMRIPIYVDPEDPQTIDFNWEGFDASGEVERYFAKNAEEARPMVHDAMPDATRTMMVDGWVEAVEVGGMSAADFDEAIAGAVTSGMLTEEEAATARARLAG